MARVLSNIRITQHYGNNGHTGVDLGATSDRKVFANSSGTVQQIQTGYGNAKGSTGMASYGNMVLIKHPNGMKTRYAHLQNVNVSIGQYVSAGQQIGVQGNTGNSYGTHLHYEVYNSNGSRINPESYLETPVYKVQTTNDGVTGDIFYKAHDIIRNGWHNEVINDKDYAGSSKNQPIDGIKAKCVHGLIFVNVHLLEASDNVWCGEVSSANYNNNDDNSYAGVFGKKIDKVKIRSTKGFVEYRVKTLERGWLPWVDSRTGNYAGNKGETIVAIQMK